LTRKEEPNEPDTTSIPDQITIGIGIAQAIGGRIDVGTWIRKAVQDHNVRFREGPIDVFATATSRLPDGGGRS